MFKFIFIYCCLFFSIAVAQLNIVTSIHPYYSLLSQLVGEAGSVTRLLPPGASPHTFDPSPRDVAQLAAADLIVMNGDLDSFLLGLAEASGSGAVRLAVMELVTSPLESGHEGEGVNPHIWLDPVLMQEIVPALVEVLSGLEPASAALFEANGAALMAELEALNSELEALLEPVQGVAFVPFHDAWPYFAQRYGLNLVVEIEPAPGREPSPAYIAAALQLIRASGASAIFSEIQLPASAAEVVATNAGVDLYILDPVGGSEATASYAELLRFNARVIASALTKP